MIIRPLALYIGLRYTRAKRRNHFISFISLASMIGIALGVMVLITVLSVMNGFDSEIRARFFAIAPEVTVFEAAISNSGIQKKIESVPGVIDAAAFVAGAGMLSSSEGVDGVRILGIVPAEENKVSQLNHAMVSGSLESLVPGQYHMAIGNKLATTLGISLGDKVTVFTPEIMNTPAGLHPRIRRFTVTGIFDTKSGFGFDSGLAYIQQEDATKLFPQGEFGWHVKIKDIYSAPKITKQLENILPPGFSVTDWTQQYGSLFQALAMEKTMMFVILLLIVAVAVFNLVSTLVMVVNDKRADIAILRTLGASPKSVMSIFIIQGTVIGLIGVIFGVIGGIILSLNATAIVGWIQQVFHVQFVSESVYFINFLPSRLSGYDVLNVSIVALVMSILATIYPAILAFRTQPAEALRYE